MNILQINSSARGDASISTRLAQAMVQRLHAWDADLHRAAGKDPNLPADTRLWAALQHVGGGTWGGCVYDVEAIVNKLEVLARVEIP